jgi:hypothetical protein
VLANPHFEDIVVKDFATLEGPTLITHGLAESAV